MRFEELLRSLASDAKIKVGAVDGTGYFYVGTKHDMEDNMPRYAQAVELHSIESVKRAYNAFRQSAQQKVSPYDYAMQWLDDKAFEFSTDNYINFLGAYFRMMQRKKQTYHIMRDHRMKFVALPKREVIAHYMSDDVADQGYLIIILEGYEMGRYWFSQEADRLPSFRLAAQEEEEEEPDVSE